VLQKLANLSKLKVARMTLAVEEDVAQHPRPVALPRLGSAKVRQGQFLNLIQQAGAFAAGIVGVVMAVSRQRGIDRKCTRE
jgi:hypothetical protein